MSDIWPYLSSSPLVDINEELIPTKLNSSYSIREIVIITNSSVDDMTISI